MMNLPVAYICLYYGAIPESVVIVAIVVSQICLAARLYMLRSMILLKVSHFFNDVYINVLAVTVLSLIIPTALSFYLEESLWHFFLLTIVSVVSTLIIEYFVGCNNEERFFIKSKILRSIDRNYNL